MIIESLKKAITEYNSGEYSQAITTLLISEYSEEDYEVYYYLGLCYIKLGDFQSGREHLSHSLNLDDNLLRTFQIKMLLAYTSIQVEEFKGAELELKGLLDSGYESARLYSLLGYTYYKSNMVHKSIQNYRKAISIDPDNSNALNALGYILSEYVEDLGEAETLCRRALSINVDNPAYLDSLGWVCLKNSKLCASESFFNRALKLRPEDSVINYHIRELNKMRSMS